MRIVLCAGAGVAVLGLALATLSPAVTSANPAPVGMGNWRAAPTFRAPRRWQRRKGFASPTTCATNDPGLSFVGIGPNVAGGQDSAVLGGLENQACDENSGVGAGNGNDIGSGNQDSFIGGGQSNGIAAGESFVGAGTNNSSGGFASFVGAGSLNSASVAGAFVGGGDLTYVFTQFGEGNDPMTLGNVAAGQDSFVGAGDLNAVSGPGSFIGAGGSASAKAGATTASNQIAGTDSFIGAGDLNNVSASQAVIGGGASNSVSGAYGTIAGGEFGVASGKGAAIGGGDSNESGYLATVPGGYHNDATGEFSFAAGYDADASQAGSFVWSDYSPGAKRLISKRANQFAVRASGGVTLYSNAAQTTGVNLAPGGGSWSSASDRNLKDRVTSVDDATILAKVASLPVSEWSYISERGVRHLGPMAQDFYATFKVGEDDRHITTIDEDGVALAAIKALHAENQRLRTHLARSDARAALEAASHARDEARIAMLEKAVAALTRVRTGARTGLGFASVGGAQH